MNSFLEKIRQKLGNSHLIPCGREIAIHIALEYMGGVECLAFINSTMVKRCDIYWAAIKRNPAFQPLTSYVQRCAESLIYRLIEARDFIEGVGSGRAGFGPQPKN